MIGEILLHGFMLSALYILIAMGFTLIFGVGNVLNFAHGGLITIGAFMAYLISNPVWLGLPPFVGLTLATISGAAIGGVIYLSSVRYVENDLVVGIVTLVIGFLIAIIFRVFVTGNAITVDLIVGGSTTVNGIQIQNFNIFIFLTSWVIVLLILYFVNRTKSGLGMIAMSMNKRGAKLVGIDTNRINLYAWILASGLAAFAGVLLMMLQTGSWDMGINPLILSFAIVILGGLGSIKGSILGAHVVGFAETTVIIAFSPEFQGMASLVLLLIVLIVKPEGLYGREVPG